MNKNHLSKSIGTLVRLEPPAEDADGSARDDDWRILDVKGGFVELENTRAFQRTRIAFDGIYTFHEDPNRATTLQKFGFLVLHVQVHLEPGGIDVRPFPSPRQPARHPAPVPQAQAQPIPVIVPQEPKSASPALSVRAVTGTANVRGRLLHSADVVVENSGGPCTLVAYSTLTSATPGQKPPARWEYHPRSVRGGFGQSVYSVATLEPPDSSGLRVVKVRGEDMAMRGRYEGVGVLWFDVEWEFYVDEDGRLEKVLTCTSHVSLNEERDGLLVDVRDKAALAVGRA